MASSHAFALVAREARLPRASAAVFAYVAYWHPKASYEYNGRKWTYATRADLEAETGYAERTLDRALNDVESRGLLERATAYNGRARRRVTLLCLTAAGQALRSSAVQQNSGLGKTRRSGGSPDDTLAAREPATRRRQSRKNVGTHSTDGPSPISLTDMSSVEAGKKPASPVSIGTGGKDFLQKINQMLEERDLPVWKKEQWSLDHADRCVERLIEMQLSEDEFFVIFGEILENWETFLHQLPRKFMEYEGNRLRPSALCLSSMIFKLVSLSEQETRDAEAAAARASLLAVREAQMEAMLPAMCKHLIEGGSRCTFKDYAPPDAWDQAHAIALENSEYKLRHERTKALAREKAFMEHFCRQLGKHRIPDFDESERHLVRTAIDLHIQDNFDFTEMKWFIPASTDMLKLIEELDLTIEQRDVDLSPWISD
jgi:hypothetical protein